MLRQSNFDHSFSPPSNRDSTSISSAGGNVDIYTAQEYFPGHGAKCADNLPLSIADKHQAFLVSYVVHLRR